MSATTTGAPVVEVTDLHKSFGSNHVLQGLDATIHQGEVVCVIGPSGSGKSTFLRCINLLEQPTSGSIKVDGEEVTDPDCDIDAIRRNMGMVFQQFNLFPHLSVLENCTIAQTTVLKRRRDEAEAMARENLEKVPEALRPGSNVSEVTSAESANTFRIRVDEPLEALLGSEGLQRLGAIMAVDGDGILRGVVTIEQVSRALQPATRLA